MKRGQIRCPCFSYVTPDVAVQATMHEGGARRTRSEIAFPSTCDLHSDIDTMVLDLFAPSTYARAGKRSTSRWKQVAATEASFALY